MNSHPPIAFEIQRIGRKTERIPADTLQTEGTPPKYIFSRRGKRVFDIFLSALEREPKPLYSQTSQAKAGWKAFVKKQDAANQVPHLER